MSDRPDLDDFDVGDCEVGDLADPWSDDELPYAVLLARALDPDKRATRRADAAALAAEYRELFGGGDG